MRRLLLMFILASANREADRFFFAKKDLNNSNALQSFIPALPMNKNGIYLKSFHERIFPMVNTKFRISFNPARCDPQFEHRIIIGLLDDYKLEKEINLKSNMTIRSNDTYFDNHGQNDGHYAIPMWKREFGYQFFRQINGINFPSNYPDLLMAFTMNDAHFYVEIKGRYLRLFLFEEDSQEILAYQVIFTEKQARFFILMANQHKNCPTFISMVDRQFPFWVPGMALNSYVNGTILADPREQKFPAFDIILYVSLGVVVYCLLMYLFAIPFLINKIYPDKLANLSTEEDVQIHNFGLATEEKSGLSSRDSVASKKSKSRRIAKKSKTKESLRTKTISPKNKKKSVKKEQAQKLLPTAKKRKSSDMHEEETQQDAKSTNIRHPTNSPLIK